jgi:hypothetical protein
MRYDANNFRSSQYAYERYVQQQSDESRPTEGGGRGG